MPNLVEGTVIQINIDGRHDAQQLLLTTTWAIISDAWPGDPDMDETFDAIHSFMDGIDNLFAAYAGCLSEDVTSLKTTFQAIYPTRYSYRTYSFQAGAGEVAEPSFPPNVAHAVTLRADDAGPGNRGTKHIGGVPLTFSEAGLVTTAGLTALSGLAEMLKLKQGFEVGAFNNFELQPLIAHRANISLSPYATSYTIGSATRVERRRTVGLGS